MRYFTLCVTLMLTLFFSSCTTGEDLDRLGYQDEKLYIEAVFTVDDESIPALIDIAKAEYDEGGLMLARDATLTFGENSIISGVSFEFSAGKVYVSSGELKIPIEDESVVSGISDMISLFCISEDYYHSSEKIKVSGLSCERSVYVNGENSVEVTLDLSCMLPTDIVAIIDGRTISAHISMIKTE